MTTPPIPQRKPEQGTSILNTVEDFVNGVFNVGSEYLGQWWELEKQKDLLKYQAELERYNAGQSTGSWSPPQTSTVTQPTVTNAGAGILGSISPVAVALFGVAAILIAR